MGSWDNFCWWCLEDCPDCEPGTDHCNDFTGSLPRPLLTTGARRLYPVAREVAGTPNWYGDGVDAYGHRVTWYTNQFRRFKGGGATYFWMAPCYMPEPSGADREWGCLPWSGLNSTCARIIEGSGEVQGHDLWCVPSNWHGHPDTGIHWTPIDVTMYGDSYAEGLILVHDQHTCTGLLNHWCWGREIENGGVHGAYPNNAHKAIWEQIGVYFQRPRYRTIPGKIEHPGIRALRNLALDAITAQPTLDRVYRWEEIPGEGNIWDLDHGDYWASILWDDDEEIVPVTYRLAGTSAELAGSFRLRAAQVQMWLLLVNRIGGGSPSVGWVHAAIQLRITGETYLADDQGAEITPGTAVVKATAALGAEVAERGGWFLPPVSISGIPSVEWRGELGHLTSPLWPDVDDPGSGNADPGNTCCCFARNLHDQHIAAKRTRYTALPPGTIFDDLEDLDLWQGTVSLNLNINGYLNWGEICGLDATPCS